MFNKPGGGPDTTNTYGIYDSGIVMNRLSSNVALSSGFNIHATGGNSRFYQKFNALTVDSNFINTIDANGKLWTTDNYGGTWTDKTASSPQAEGLNGFP